MTKKANTKKETKTENIDINNDGTIAAEELAAKTSATAEYVVSFVTAIFKMMFNS